MTQTDLPTDLAALPTAALVALYNEHSGGAQIKKFADRAKAVARVAAVLAKVREQRAIEAALAQPAAPSAQSAKAPRDSLSEKIRYLILVEGLVDPVIAERLGLAGTARAHYPRAMRARLRRQGKLPRK